MPPENLKYSKTHEWVAVENQIATIGITDFAVHLLSDLVFAELPAVGKKLKQGEPFGEVESVKAVSDLYAPVSGEVIAVNAKVAETPDLLKNDPFGEGWVAKIRLATGATLDHLLDAAAYETQVNSEPH